MKATSIHFIVSSKDFSAGCSDESACFTRFLMRFPLCAETFINLVYIAVSSGACRAWPARGNVSGIYSIIPAVTRTTQ